MKQRQLRILFIGLTGLLIFGLIVAGYTPKEEEVAPAPLPAPVEERISKPIAAKESWPIFGVY